MNLTQAKELADFCAAIRAAILAAILTPKKAKL